MIRVAGAVAAPGALSARGGTRLAALRALMRCHASESGQQPQPVQQQSQGDGAPAQHELVVTLADFDLSKSKLRLDAFLAAKLPAASRARLQASIKSGLVAVNGRPQAKASHGVRPGDVVACDVLPAPPLEAAPEALPLDIVYEDEHVLVINKAADMVMHPSPGHYSGTLVNALLHHCSLPAMPLGAGAPAPLSLEGAAAAAAAAGAASSMSSVDEPAAAAAAAARPAASAGGGAAAGPQDLSSSSLDASSSDPELTELEAEDEEDGAAAFQLLGTADGTVRPGIVHRLDKGTTGLLVVAKTDAAHQSLAQQFKDRTVQRTYVAVALGVPRPPAGRVATNIGRDLRDRKRMASFAYASARGRTAASNYTLLEVLAGGGASLVQWRLETGRTHQIRVHAKHIGHPLLADDTYSSLAAVGSIVGAGKPPRASAAQAAARALARPALHAKTLGFIHPATGAPLLFDSKLPADLEAALAALRGPPFV